MPGATARRLILLAVLLAGAWLLAGARAGGREVPPRWPEGGAVFETGAWSPGAPAVQETGGVAHLRRELRSAGGETATVLLSSSTTAKRILGKAEVPLLGAGYAVEPAPASLVAPRPGRTAVLARGPQAEWLMVYGYGQRHGPLRGPLQGAAQGWGVVLLDAVLQRPNDFYLLRVLTRLPTGAGSDAPEARRRAAAESAAALADSLLERVGAWYGAPPPAAPD